MGGSDSSCYALMTAAFARGHMQPTTTLADAPWPEASRTFAPGGFVPSPTRADSASPICAPGFSLLLAPLYVVGGRDAIFLLTPLAGALLVWLTFVFGTRLAGPSAGAAAATVIAATPVFVFQVVQPMNDVAVATVWMAVLVLAAGPQVHSGWIGGLTGLAILIRPNLAPAALIVAAWCLAGGLRRFLVFGAAAAPFAIAVVTFNTRVIRAPAQVWLRFHERSVFLRLRPAEHRELREGTARNPTWISSPRFVRHIRCSAPASAARVVGAGADRIDGRGLSVLQAVPRVVVSPISAAGATGDDRAGDHGRRARHASPCRRLGACGGGRGLRHDERGDGAGAETCSGSSAASGRWGRSCGIACRRTPFFSRCGTAEACDITPSGKPSSGTR